MSHRLGGLPEWNSHPLTLGAAATTASVRRSLSRSPFGERAKPYSVLRPGPTSQPRPAPSDLTRCENRLSSCRDSEAFSRPLMASVSCENHAQNAAVPVGGLPTPIIPLS